MAGTLSLWRREAVFLTAMLAVETSVVGMSTLFKVATSKGLNIYPFIAYSYLLASLLLLPSFLFTNRSRSLPPLSLSILCKIGLLGFLGSLYVITGYMGIKYSNPTLASAISNITPALTFILAFIFRMEKVSLKERCSVAKVMGTILSVMGALVMTTAIGLVVEKNNPSVWIIHFDITLITILTVAIITSAYYVIHSWTVRHKGLVYLAIFKPLSILIAVVMGTIFLNDSLYLGCLIGGLLITLGFYAVMWGKANEDKELLSFSGKDKSPLLSNCKNDY